MTGVFTDFFRQQLYNSFDRVVPLDPTQNLMNGKSVHWVYFRQAAAFSGPNDARYTGITTVADLAGKPGWGPPLTPNSATQAVGTSVVGATTYCIANPPFAMLGGWVSSTVTAAALILEGTYGSAVNPIIFLTDSPFQGGMVMDPDDTLIARPVSAIGGLRVLFSWPNYVDGATQALPVEGSMAVLTAPPPYEISYMQHCWLYPQRVNLIANPSFEGGTNHWRSSGTVSRVQATDPKPAAPGGGAWYGRFVGGNAPAAAGVTESNQFPLDIASAVEGLWTVQVMARGSGTLKVGLLSWEADFAQTAVDWGDGEQWDLPPDGYLHVYALRHSWDGVWGQIRLEASGTLEIDNVLCEPDWLSGWRYFDGDSTYGARDDFGWYGGANRKGATYSTWYNHRRAVTGRLFAYDIDEADFTITDAEIEDQGFIYKWVPAGVRVTPHLDVLRPNDIQEAVPDVAGTAVTPYKTSDTDATGVTSPWRIVATRPTSWRTLHT